MYCIMYSVYRILRAGRNTYQMIQELERHTVRGTGGGMHEKKIGIVGATATVVGFVIGTSIFVLPAQLAGVAGPAVVMSYAIACLIALLLCLVTAELGCRLPVNGGSFVIVAQNVGPLPGFLIMWTMVIAVAIGMAAVALGLANYLAALLPGIAPQITAIGFITLFVGLNLVGLRTAIWSQAFLTAALLCAKGLFFATAWIPFTAARLSPFAPHGVLAVLAAVVPAYFSFGGFSVLLEIGGEVRHPRRNIPMAIAIAFVLVFAMYIAVPLLLVGGLPWQQLPALAAPALTLIEPVAPDWLVAVVRLGILGGAVTAINAILLGYSRNLAAMARAGFLPSLLARSGGPGGQPQAAIIAIGAVTVVSIAAGASVTQYATIFVVAFLGQQMFLAFALLAVTSRGQPAVLSRGIAMASARLLIIVSFALLLAAAWSAPGMLAVTAVVMAAGWGLFMLRQRRGAADGDE